MSGLLKVATKDFSATQGARSTFGENLAAGYSMSRLTMWNTELARKSEARKPLDDFFGQAMGQVEPENRPRFSQLVAQTMDEHFGEVLKQREGTGLEETLEEFSKIGVAVPEELATSLRNERNAIYERDAQAYEAALETVSRGGFRGQVAAFGGGVGAQFTDPINLATLPLGAPAGYRLASVIAIEAAINGTLEAAQTPGRNKALEALGQEQESVLQNALVGAAFGAAIPAGLKGLKLTADGAQIATRSVLNATRSVRRPLAKLASSDANPEVQAAANVIMQDLQDETQAFGQETPQALSEYRERRDTALEAAETGLPPDMPDRPLNAVPDRSYDATELVSPNDLRVQPEVFQFKSDIVAPGGVTPKLRDVSEWVPHRAGIAIVYEYADGTRAIADGHQRVALAKRIMGQTGEDIKLRAEVFKESDDFTVEDIRALAAMKNIAEAADGMTAKMARDAAKVLRADPDAISQLPSGPGLLRAKRLGRLADDAFDLYINEVIDERFAEQIGRLVDDPALHLPMARLLERLKPDTTEQAASILEQALQAPVSRETSADLFGEMEMVESLYLERAKVLERVMKNMREDRNTFRTLTDRAETIEDAGNQLDGMSNAQAREAVEKVIGNVEKLAHRAGPISEALNEAAKKYKETGRLQDAATDALKSIRREVSRSGVDGFTAGGSGRNVKSERAQLEAPDPNEQFSDPVGQAAQDQVQQTPLISEPQFDRSNSIIAIRRETGEVIGEFFDNQELPNFNQGNVALVRAGDYLARYNRLTAELGDQPPKSEIIKEFSDDPEIDVETRRIAQEVEGVVNEAAELMDAVPVGLEKNEKDEWVVSTMSRADLEADLQADEEFAEVLGVCLK